VASLQAKTVPLHRSIFGGHISLAAETSASRRNSPNDPTFHHQPRRHVIPKDFLASTDEELMQKIKYYTEGGFRIITSGACATYNNSGRITGVRNA